MTAMPFVSYERTVFYRERASSMYSSFPYSSALALVEACSCLSIISPSARSLSSPGYETAHQAPFSIGPATVKALLVQAAVVSQTALCRAAGSVCTAVSS